MAFWHGYFGIENINLNASQKGELVDALKALGQNTAPQPCHRNHRRVRLDSDAVVFEARFNDNNLTVAKFKQYLGTIFSVDPATIDHEITTPGGNTVVVFSRGGTDYLRVALFGGIGSDWETSRQACQVYLKANQEEWESEEP